MNDLEGKTMLILGCGYLGLTLAGKALRRGMAIKAVSRNAEALAEARALGAEVRVDLVHEDGWHGFAGAEVDFVVNCVSSAGGGLAGYRTSYVEGNRSLGRWAEAVGFEGTAIYTSSVSVYGDAEGNWVNEVSASEPDTERGALVRESELAFIDATQGGRGVVLRLAGLYGPGRHLLMDRLKEGPAALPGWGDYYLNLVRIEDAAEAALACVADPALPAGIYSVVDDEPTLKEAIVAWLADTLGVAVPEFTGDRDGSGRSARRLGETGRPANRRVSNRRLKAATKWSPEYPSFREGFADLLRRDRS